MRFKGEAAECGHYYFGYPAAPIPPNRFFKINPRPLTSLTREITMKLSGSIS